VGDIIVPDPDNTQAAQIYHSLARTELHGELTGHGRKRRLPACNQATITAGYCDWKFIREWDERSKQKAAASVDGNNFTTNVPLDSLWQTIVNV
jgi:hypothetical protein